MERYYHEQVERIDRLMMIIEADDPHKVVSGLSFYDVLIFAFQSMWHLKDWILNDLNFGAKDIEAVKSDIYSARCLLICSDLANGTKHLSLNYPKVGGALMERTGVHIDTSKGISREFYYVSCPAPTDEFNGMEVRTLLRKCRDTWESIISEHYLSEVNVKLAEQGIQQNAPADKRSSRH